MVNEIFGPTIQGEGPSTGRRCGFLRLGGCNLTCRWCDTPYTWDWKGVSDTGVAFVAAEELHPTPRSDVRERLLGLGVDLIVISGGEPLSQQRALAPLVADLRARGVEVEIETNGTIAPSADLIAPGIRYNVSPKLTHSGVPEDRRIVPSSLSVFARDPGAIFKFVCHDVADLDEVAELVKRFQLDPVWIMPAGQTSEEVLAGQARIADAVVVKGWNLTSRLHVLVWETKRGV